MKRPNLILYGIVLGVLTLVGCTQKKDVVDFNQFNENYLKLFNAHDASALAQLYTEDALIYQSDLSEPLRGNKELEKSYSEYFRAFPDINVEFIKVISSGDQVCVEFRETGTFTGPLSTPQGEIQPTGQKFDITGAGFMKINSDGYIIEDKTYFDHNNWMKQLGIVQ